MKRLIILISSLMSLPLKVSTQAPTLKPTTTPLTKRPVSTPTRKPWTIRPIAPTPARSIAPSVQPLAATSVTPMSTPTEEPSTNPTLIPNSNPSGFPSKYPSTYVSLSPSVTPTDVPLPPSNVSASFAPTNSPSFLLPSSIPVAESSTISPSQIITSNDVPFSRYVFFGDATFQYMLCFNASQSPPTVYTSCNNYFDNYFANSANLLINCSTTSNLYCNTAFYAAFPGAINLAQGLNTRINNVASRVLNYAPVSRLANSSVSTSAITNVIVSVGWNDITTNPSNPASSYVPMYNSLLSTINKKFPQAQILLVGIRPVTFTTGSIAVLRNTINNILNSTYTNNPSFPFVKFIDFTSYFNINGVRDANAFITPVHFSSRGYGYLEKAIKTAIDTYYTVQTEAPTELPVLVPVSAEPTSSPSVSFLIASEIPSFLSITSPSLIPTFDPSVSPSMSRTVPPSECPTISPLLLPSSIPSYSFTTIPSIVPSVSPLNYSTSLPSKLSPSKVPAVALTKRPLSTKPTATPVCSPSRAPWSRTDYSDFLFFGDSQFQYWLCFKPTDATSAIRGSNETKACVDFLSTYFENVDNFDLSNCSSRNDTYCSSFFYKFFPNAVNIAIRGTTINQWISDFTYDPINSFKSTIRNVLELTRLRYIVIELGVNNLFAANKPSVTAALYSDLLFILNRVLPHCKILVTAVLPCVASATGLDSKGSSAAICNQLTDELNDLIRSNISVSHPYAKFLPIKTYFQIGIRGIDKTLLNGDQLHLSKSGYTLLKSAIQDNLDLVFA